MRLASYNVENLFLRARALDSSDSVSKQAVADQAKLNVILQKAKYLAADKQKILQLLEDLGLDKADDGGDFAILRQNRGHLVKRPKTGKTQVVANGRADWIGWVELKLEAVNEVATRMTAKVIAELKADVLAVVEAESRPALLLFSQGLLKDAGAKAYGHIMLIDGNDDRGIDVGLLTGPKYDIASIRSHVDDKDSSGLIFSRDCAQYSVVTPLGNRVIVLVNHLKSKGFGGPTTSNAKRRRQALRIKQIYEQLQKDGEKLIAVVGDLNDTPDSAPLAPLMKTDLRDITEHAGFIDDGRPGTYKNGTASGKIDYVLLSPALFKLTKSGGIFRKGVWGGTHGDLFPHFPEMTREVEAASDHAAIWADIDV
jgi:endonuclease/exonuclease/phosphatase family metal-dependent hydrolase